MRLDFALDAFYLVSSLWGAMPDSPVCSVSPYPVSAGVIPEIVASSTFRTRAEVTAFVDVNVVPMDTERVLSNQTVLIEDGMITALGPAGEILVPAGAVRIDGRGKYIIPGLAEMHGGGLSGSAGNAAAGGEVYMLSAELAGGVTAIRQDSRVDSQTVQKLEYTYAAQDNWRPYLYLAGNVAPVVSPAGLTAESAAAAYKTVGYHYTLDNYVYNGYKAGRAPDSILVAIYRQGLPLVTHDHDNIYSPADLQAHGASGGAIEHLYWFYGPLGTGRPASEIPALVAAALRAGIWVTPTMECLEGKYRTKPYVVELSRQLVKALQDAGVGLLLGTDNGSVHDELAALVRAGLSPYQALLAGTRNVAQFLSLNERGTVAVGKRADLVLLAGNPLKEIDHTREVAGVMLHGRWFTRMELDQRLLTRPTKWFDWAMRHSGLYDAHSLSEEQKKQLSADWRESFGAVGDSLELVMASSNQESSRKRLVQRFTEQLGKFRAILTPGQHKRFDPIARLWMREQARQGYTVTMPGVMPVP